MMISKKKYKIMKKKKRARCLCFYNRIYILKINSHTCVSVGMSQDHRRLDTAMVCDNIVPLLKNNLGVTVKFIIDHIRAKFNYTISYRKAWSAKNKAIEHIYGSWVQSYRDLPWWLMAMEKWVSGTVIRFETSPTAIHGEVHFERLFLAFKPCIEGFAHCKPIVQVDGTFLTGKYKGTLLLAVAQDGNAHIFPVAYAIVEGETKDAWNLFLKHLRENVTPQENICLISDRHASIKSAFENPSNGWNHSSSHVYCIRHIAQNFMRAIKNRKLRKYAVNMGYAPSEPTFMYWRHKIAKKSPTALAWVDDLPKPKWTQAYDGGIRWGHMTSNLAEAMNSVFKDIRGLPITALVQATYYRMAKLFERISEAVHKSNSHVVNQFDRQNYTFIVEETEDPHEGRPMDIFKVELKEKMCDCGKFQALHLPCSHVIAACSHANLSYEPFIDDVYKAATVFAVYDRPFPAVRNQGLWPDYLGDVVCPRLDMKRTKRGRPKNSRIRTEMDEFEKRENRCGLCRVSGHKCHECPNAAGPSN
ncbi:unnamed protein product [Trifolium pratense]|uniref:Uncharacterized protein n=1 Tax=Trifolium pratense TaxID=57577 RepID=A0ACB0IKD7_TRIPR|nr:unnamed protein product [Trifolium pratense]